MKMIHYIMLIILTSLVACGDGIVVPPDPPEEEVPIFEMEWATRLDANELIGAVIDDQYIYNEELILFGDLDDPATIYGRNLKDGEENWKYRYEGFDDANIDYAVLVGSQLICTTGKRVFGFNLDNQEKEWEINLIEEDLLRGPSVAFEDKLYLLGYSNWLNPNQSQKLLEIDPYTGTWITILDLPSDSIGNKGISPPVGYSDELDGRELLIMNHYPNHNDPPEIATQDIMAIDKATHEVIWKTENFTEYYSSNSLHAPIVYKDLVITGGDWSIYAFDARTGEQVWRYELPSYDYGGQFWTTTNHLIKDGRLFLNPLSEEVLCINPETGQQIWLNNKGGANCTDNMIYYEKEDYLVFTSWGYGSVMIIDALSGETVHRERSFENSAYNNDVVYDEARDMFYTSSYKHAIGFKVNGRE